jgi:hypothetical protein
LGVWRRHASNVAGQGNRVKVASWGFPVVSWSGLAGGGAQGQKQYSDSEGGRVYLDIDCVGIGLCPGDVAATRQRRLSEARAAKRFHRLSQGIRFPTAWSTVRAQPMIRLGRTLTRSSPVSICVFCVFCGSIVFVYYRHNLSEPLRPAEGRDRPIVFKAEGARLP